MVSKKEIDIIKDFYDNDDTEAIARFLWFHYRTNIKKNIEANPILDDTNLLEILKNWKGADTKWHDIISSLQMDITDIVLEEDLRTFCDFLFTLMFI